MRPSHICCAFHWILHKCARLCVNQVKLDVVDGVLLSGISIGIGDGFRRGSYGEGGSGGGSNEGFHGAGAL